MLVKESCLETLWAADVALHIGLSWRFSPVKQSQMLLLIVGWTRNMAFLWAVSLERDDTVAMLDIGSNHGPSRRRAILMLPSQRFGLLPDVKLVVGRLFA